MHTFFIQCENEDHQIDVTDNGEFVLHAHNIDEEETAAMFGDETSKCFKILSSLKNQPDSALIEAAYSNNVELAEIALSLGANINAMVGWPLTVAAFKGYCEITRYLLDSGANTENEDKQVIKMAVIKRQFATTKLLLDAGAETSRITLDILEDLIIDDNLPLLALLLSHEINLNIIDRHILLVAAEYGRTDIVKLLLQNWEYDKHDLVTASAIAVNKGHNKTSYVLASA